MEAMDLCVGEVEVNWENQKGIFTLMERKFGKRKVQVIQVMIAMTNFTYFSFNICYL